MIKFVNNFYRFLLKPILWGISSYFLFAIVIPLFITILSSGAIICYLIQKFNTRKLKKKLKPIIEEAKQLYNVNLFESERITFYKNKNFTSVQIPDTFKNTSKIASSFKEKVGTIDCKDFFEKRDKASALTYLKLKGKNIFFSPLYNDKTLKKEIHLYDLKHLDEYEIKSILSMDISNEQKILIYNRYHLR